jgi:chemotaxis protein CheD
MSDLILGIGEYGVLGNAAGVIKTYALGSCVAIVIAARDKTWGAMAHIALPDSGVNRDKAAKSPGHFADTGIPALLSKIQTTMGMAPNRRNCIVKLAGGANIADPNDTFSIGKRNNLAIKKILWKYGLGPIAEDIGGNFSRTVRLEIATGKVILSSPARTNWEL